MTLADLIRGRRESEAVEVATAIPATQQGEAAGTVARIATIAVANPGNAKTDGTEAHPAPLWWRVSLTEPGGRTVEVDTPSGWTLPEWEAYALRYHGHGCTVTALLSLPKPRAPVNLDEALAAACEDVAGLTPAEFRSLLSQEDLGDIAAGDIHRKTLKGFALSFAERIRSGRVVVLGERTP